MNRKHSCKKVAQLLSQRLDEPLSLRDRIQLRLHLALCGNCRNVQAHLRELRQLSKNLFAEDLEFDETPARDRAGNAGLRPR